MTRPEIVNLIIQSMKEISDGSASAEFTEQTRLFGKDGVFDSLGLVTLITEIEAHLNEQHDATLVLASESAMSRKSSPFRSVGSLADYAVELLAETAHEG